MMQSVVNILLHLCKWVMSLFHITHSIDATELQRGEGDDDGEELPAHCSVLNQLHHRVAANALQGNFLFQHLLHLDAVVLVAPQPT